MTVRLGIDTATDASGVALSVDDRIVCEVTLGERRAAASLVPGIEFVLNAGRLGMSAVDELVLADGPGSFTGLRIGCATVLGLAADGSIPLRTVPSLTAAACGAVQADGQVGAALYDALRGEVFVAAYQLRDGTFTERLAPQRLAVNALPDLGPDVVVGDGAAAYAREVADWAGGVPVEAFAPRAGAGSLLDPRVYGAFGSVWEEPPAFIPEYGRKAEAQVKWEAAHGRTLPDSSRPSG